MDLAAIRKKLQERKSSQPQVQPKRLGVGMTVPLTTSKPSPLPSVRKQVIAEAWALCGGKVGELSALVMQRANEYAEGPGKHWPFEIQEYQACRDFTRWHQPQLI